MMKNSKESPKLLKRTVPFPWEREILTIDQVSQMLQVTKNTIYGLVKAGAIPATRIGNKFRFSQKAVLEAFEKMGELQEKGGKAK